MRIQCNAVLVLALVAGTAAFAPAHVCNNRPPKELLAMTPRTNNYMDTFEKAAMSFMVGSVIALSAATNVLPAEAATAAAPATPAAPVVQEKVDLKKMGLEERNKFLSKRNYDLAQRTLAEYQKFEKEAKSTEDKAIQAVKTQEGVVAKAKKDFIAVNDKLSQAKKEQMPQSAITELSAGVNSARESLKNEEKKLGELQKAQSKTNAALKTAQANVAESKKAVDQAKKKAEQAEKDFKAYQKQVQEQKKKQAEAEKKAKAAAQKALQDQELKLKKLQEETKRLEALKESSAKELQNKMKLIEAEKKSLEKMKSSK